MDSFGECTPVAAWGVTPAGRRYPPEQEPDHVTGVAALAGHVVTADGAFTVPVVELLPPPSALDKGTGAICWDAVTAVAVADQLRHAAQVATAHTDAP